ncbi:MAG: zinc ribbon domain-containing protein [Nitrososphaeria archaeon]
MKDIDEKIISVYENRKPEPVKPALLPVKCPRCGAENSPGTRFCGKCGSPLSMAEIAKPEVNVELMRQQVLELLKQFEILKHDLQELKKQYLNSKKGSK